VTTATRRKHNLHEIKHDGFRMPVRRSAGGVRLFTRNGHDWTGRFPLIARARRATQVEVNDQ
jgi:ATP-dependent DNA ligase